MIRLIAKLRIKIASARFCNLPLFVTSPMREATIKMIAIVDKSTPKIAAKDIFHLFDFNLEVL